MQRREFLQLAHPWTDQPVGGWFWSIKLDGQRAFWDGGVSRGVPATEVPWANTSADGRLLIKPIATGLWSRNGKVIHAPDWWLDKLPVGQLLDLELYSGRGSHQAMRSVVASFDKGSGWLDVEAWVLDMPTWEQVAVTGRVVVPAAHWDAVLDRNTIEGWLKSKGATVTTGQWAFTDVVAMIRGLQENEVLKRVEQHVLPANDVLAAREVERQVALEVAQKGEGIVLRHPYRCWTAKRVHHVLKAKPSLDAEGTVVGFTWGRKTDRGSKHLGRMGALVLRTASGKRLELSGFEDSEREVRPTGSAVPIPGPCDESIRLEGKEASTDWEPVHFPRGTVVTYKYRELTVDGIEKEARYDRKRNSE